MRPRSSRTNRSAAGNTGRVAGDQQNRPWKRFADSAQQRPVDAALVEQQQLGRGQQRARHRAAHGFGGLDFTGAAGRRGRELKALQHFGYAPGALQARAAVRGEQQIPPQGHVREERVALGDVAAVAAARRHVDARLGVEQDDVVQQNAAGIGFHESGDGLENERLSRPCRTIQRGKAGDFEIDVER